MVKKLLLFEKSIILNAKQVQCNVRSIYMIML